jgi:hypothetical protein
MNLPSQQLSAPSIFKFGSQEQCQQSAQDQYSSGQLFIPGQQLVSTAGNMFAYSQASMPQLFNSSQGQAMTQNSSLLSSATGKSSNSQSGQMFQHSQSNHQLSSKHIKPRCSAAVDNGPTRGDSISSPSHRRDLKKDVRGSVQFCQVE